MLDQLLIQDPAIDAHTAPRVHHQQCTFPQRSSQQQLSIRSTNEHEQNKFDTTCIAYSEGYTGPARLRKAMAVHMNEYFQPEQPLGAEHITFAAGVTALNEACALALCDPGDAILLGRFNCKS